MKAPHLLVALDDHPRVYCPSVRRTQFDFLGRGMPPSDGPVLFVEAARNATHHEDAMPGRKCALVRRVSVARGETEAARYDLFACDLERDGRPEWAASSGDSGPLATSAAALRIAHAPRGAQPHLAVTRRHSPRQIPTPAQHRRRARCRFTRRGTCPTRASGRAAHRRRSSPGPRRRSRRRRRGRGRRAPCGPTGRRRAR